MDEPQGTYIGEEEIYVHLEQQMKNHNRELFHMMRNMQT